MLNKAYSWQGPLATVFPAATPTYTNPADNQVNLFFVRAITALYSTLPSSSLRPSPTTSTTSSAPATTSEDVLGQSTDKDSSGLSPKKIAGISVGVSLSIILVVTGMMILIIMRRRRKHLYGSSVSDQNVRHSETPHGGELYSDGPRGFTLEVQEMEGKEEDRMIGGNRRLHELDGGVQAVERIDSGRIRRKFEGASSPSA